MFLMYREERARCRRALAKLAQRSIVGAVMAYIAIGLLSTTASAQATREEEDAEKQADKAKSLHSYELTRTEALFNRLDEILAGGMPKWHPYFESAYSGGGFTLGTGYTFSVSPYNTLDVRGSYSLLGYKRVETEFIAPRLFHRRGELSLLGGWREATQVDYFGIGMNTKTSDVANYLFRQPYGSATLSLRPTRRFLTLRGGAEFTRWSQRPGEGSSPSVDDVYTPQTLPGLGTTTTYLHLQGTVGFDSRTSPGYSRRGGFYGATLHNYADADKRFGFRQVDYQAIQHIPILREAWVISLRAVARTTYTKDGQQVPFFMLPYVGSGHTLRGFISHRFHDNNALVLNAEWRIMVNRFVDTAFFYDTGKVAASKSDLDFNGLKNDFGFGVRFHGPFATPLRIEVARSNEGTRFVFTTTPIF